MEEIWKDIKDYEGLYQVSNLGRVKSLDRTIEQYNGHNYSKRLCKGKILKCIIGKWGYLQVGLSNKNKIKIKKVHRLVAEAFIHNPNNLPIINHRDGNKENNCVNNLEFCTQKENIQHAWVTGLCEETRELRINNLRLYHYQGGRPKKKECKKGVGEI